MCVGPNLRDEDVHMVVEQTIKEADTIDNDGRISREEFSQVRHPPAGCGFGFGLGRGRSVCRCGIHLLVVVFVLILVPGGGGLAR
jgi:hypothetical protein